MRYVVVAVLLVAGCGSGGGERDVLAGTAWTSPIDGFTCEKGFEFGERGDYMFAIACELTDGTAGAYMETGDYSVDERSLVTIARRASCPADQVQQVFATNFSVTATALTLSVASGLTTYTRYIPGPPGGGTIAYGCFDSTGAFAQFPLTPL